MSYDPLGQSHCKEPKIPEIVPYRSLISDYSKFNRYRSRLLTNLYLIAQGYPPVVLKKEDRGKYYRFLRAADEGNLGLFANFIAKAQDESLSMYLSIFGGINELLSLKELAKNATYSQEYLSLRARQGVLDAVKIGRVWYTSKRAIDQYLSEHSKR